MTIEQKIFSKLEPHAKRIESGDGNDFDFLPAVLLQVMEEQKRQAKLLNDASDLLATMIRTGDANAVQTKAQINAFESVSQRTMDLVQTAITDTQDQIQKSQIAILEELAMMNRASEQDATRTNETLTAIALKIESFGSSTNRSHIVLKRFMIAGLLASTAILGSAIVLLQRP
jgi:hypothetical protein